MNIVIAEDEGITRLWLEELLKSLDYTVISFGDGLGALHHLNGSEATYIALLDWQLPGIDGIEICRRLKADPLRRSSCYLIMLSGQSNPAKIAMAREAGADDYIVKPFVPTDVHARIQAGAAILAGSSRTADKS